MSQAATIGEEQPLTLAETVSVITGTSDARLLIVYETTVDLYLVTKAVADGAALPATGRPKVCLSTERLVVIDIAGRGFLGVAGTAAGTARVEFVR
jgi:hypothetical protein